MTVPTLWDFERKEDITMENSLRGAVLGKFPSIKAFSDAMQWDRKKGSRIVNRIQKPSATDMEKMAIVLDVQDASSFVRIFLPSVSTMWEK